MQEGTELQLQSFLTRDLSGRLDALAALFPGNDPRTQEAG